MAAYTAAPEEMPTNRPSFCASSRDVRMASSPSTWMISSTTELSLGFRDKARSDPLYLVRSGFTA